MQEKRAIDSDLVDQMIAMYRVRPDLIIENLEKNDLALVDEILRQNLADINLYLKHMEELTSTAINKQ